MFTSKCPLEAQIFQGLGPFLQILFPFLATLQQLWPVTSPPFSGKGPCGHFTNGHQEPTRNAIST